jgi:hypothetical protein
LIVITTAPSSMIWLRARRVPSRRIRGPLEEGGFTVHHDLPGLGAGVMLVAKRPRGSSVLVTFGRADTGTIATLIETLPST